MLPEATVSAFSAVDRAALAVLVGLCASWLWLSTRDNEDLLVDTPGLGTLLGLSLACLAVSSGVDLVSRAATLADVGITEAWRYVPRILTQSDYGQSWLLRSAALVVIALLWLWRRSPPLQGVSGLAAVGAALIAFAVSGVGHAAEDGSLTLLNLVNTVHIIAGCVWGGTVVVYGWSILPHLRRLRASEAIAETAVRLSTLAGSALAIVLATGLYHAWIQIETIDGLLTTEYGWILLAKLGLVAIMMGIGALNRFFVVPSIEAWARPPRLSRDADGPVSIFLTRLRIDIVVFAAILICAVILGNSTPARHALAEAAMPASSAAGASPATIPSGG